jgi:serine O-acetyltransferase
VLDNLQRDAARLYTPGAKSTYLLEALLFNNGFQAVVCYRLARWFKKNGIPFFGPFFSRLGLLLTGVEISHAAEIGPGLMISHGTGIVIGGYTRIGQDVTLLHQVTLGSPSPDRVPEMPTIGDRVFIGAGAKLIGKITIGDDTFIGANAVVTRNIPAGSKVVVLQKLVVKGREGADGAERQEAGGEEQG